MLTCRRVTSGAKLSDNWSRLAGSRLQRLRPIHLRMRRSSIGFRAWVERPETENPLPRATASLNRV
jgi:hypothetical protein